MLALCTMLLKIYTLVATWNSTWRNLDIACNLIIFHKLDVPGPLLGRGPLWFDSRKRPPPVSDYSVFAFCGGRVREVRLYTKIGDITRRSEDFNFIFAW